MTRLLSSRGLEGTEFEQVLSDCLDRLRAGDTVEDCLIRYPAYAGRLAPLLQVAERLQVPDGPSMSAAGLRAGRARLLERAAQLRTEEGRLARPGSASRAGEGSKDGRLVKPPTQSRRPPVGRVRSHNFQTSSLPVFRRLASLAAAVLLLLGLVLGGGAITASAASNSLPGSRWYPIKRTTEDVITSLAFTPQLRARAHLAWADRRLEEVGALMVREGVVYRTVLTALQSEMERALAAAEQADAETLTAIVEQTEHQQSVLEEYLARAPEPSRRDLEGALAASAEVNRFARSALSGEPPGGAVAGLVASRTPQPTQQASAGLPSVAAAVPTPLTSASWPEAGQSPEPTGASPGVPAAASATPGASPAISGMPEVSTGTPWLSASPTPWATARPGETPSSLVTQAPAKTPSMPGSDPELGETSPAAPTSSPAPTSTALPAASRTAVPMTTPSPTPLPPVATQSATPSSTALPTVATRSPTAAPTAEPTPTETPTPPATSVSDGWDRSGLLFVERGSTCEDSGTVWAKVKNNGEAMAGSTGWQLWYAASGPARLGDMIAEGEIPALSSEQEYSIQEAAAQGSGTYKFKAFQRPGHPGDGELWSEDIEFDAGACSP